MNEFYIAIDIGAGVGAKIGLFTDPHHHVGESLLRADEFADKIDDLVDQMLDTIDRLLRETSRRLAAARAIGIASPGLFASDGRYLLAVNVPVLTGQNLRQKLEEKTSLP